MVQSPEAILILFWFVFFRKFFWSPFSFATGEHLENYFTYWRWCGEQIRKGKTWLKDDLYYFRPGSIPFLNSFYPPHLITSLLGSFLSINLAFILYTFQLLAHYLFASIFAYKLLLLLGFSPVVCIMGATSLVYFQRFVNLNGSLAYTPCWLPFLLWAIVVGNPYLTAIGVLMMLLGGYLPMILYLSPLIMGFGITFHAYLGLFMGCCLCLPQLVNICQYYRHTVRGNASYSERGKGSTPLSYILYIYIHILKNTNGVLFVEYSFRIGRVMAVMCIFCTNWALWMIAITAFYLMMGKYSRSPIFFRIPAKWSYLLGPVMVLMACDGISGLTIVWPFAVIHLIDLLLTHPQIMFLWPFTEKPIKPSLAFEGKLAQYVANDGKVSNLPWPLRAGYGTNTRTLGYKGGSSLKDLADYFGYDSNGSAFHDWFMFKGDTDELDEFEVKYAITNRRLSDRWTYTPIRNLYINQHLLS